VPLKVAVITNTNTNARAQLIGRFGVGTVLFFALKGLLWLAVPALLATFAHAPKSAPVLAPTALPAR
jgi:hypothetical protein